jgi:hypothetical protein
MRVHASSNPIKQAAYWGQGGESNWRQPDFLLDGSQRKRSREKQDYRGDKNSDSQPQAKPGAFRQVRTDGIHGPIL